MSSTSVFGEDLMPSMVGGALENDDHDYDDWEYDEDEDLIEPYDTSEDI